MQLIRGILVGRVVSLPIFFYHVGSLHAELLSTLKLADPVILGGPLSVEIDETAIAFVTEKTVKSRCLHWYANWEPMNFAQLNPSICSATSIDESKLEGYLTLEGLDKGVLATVKYGEREDTFHPMKVRQSSFVLE